MQIVAFPTTDTVSSHADRLSMAGRRKVGLFNVSDKSWTRCRRRFYIFDISDPSCHFLIFSKIITKLRHFGF
jgi:hypothetical protein